MWQEIVLQSGREDIHSSLHSTSGNQLLLQATNHATELELATSEQEERHMALTTQLQLIEEDRNNLQVSLSKEISYLQSTILSKDAQIHELEHQAEETRREQQETQGHKESLCEQLEETRSTVTKLQKETTKGNQVIKERDLHIAALAEKVEGLQERIREVTSASAERESKAIEVARVKANHDILLLKTRLESLEMQLNKAEQREERSFATHKDFQDLHHQQMKEIRKELCAQVETLQEANKQLSEKLGISESKVKACTAEVNELTQTLESKIANCEDLESRLTETNTLHEKYQSLETTLGKAETEKESAKEETRAMKLALDEARGSYSTSIANLEASLISAVRASFRPYNNVNFVLNNNNE